jgi:hypothetical protein
MRICLCLFLIVADKVVQSTDTILVALNFCRPVASEQNNLEDGVRNDVLGLLPGLSDSESDAESDGESSFPNSFRCRVH